MALTPDQAVAQAQELQAYRAAERDALDKIRRYWRGRQSLPPIIPDTAAERIKRLARIARVNVCSIAVDSMAQSMFVDGFKAANESDNSEVWKIWQANKMDARQTGLHRATFAYGAAYAVVLPGDPVPVIRPTSPRHLTAMYGEDPDWPMSALEKLDSNGLWRLYDEELVYHLGVEKDPNSKSGGTRFVFISSNEHGLPGVVPVVRFLDEEDLDADDDVPCQGGVFEKVDVPMRGRIAPLMDIQGQIDVTTVGLLIAQWYTAFRQRWVIGWTAESEKELVKAMASEMATFDDSAQDVKVGQWDESSLEPFLSSRDSSLRNAAMVSQTPAHELNASQLVNLSAEALVATEQGRDRNADEAKVIVGESHEQMLQLAGRAGGIEVPDDAQVVWRDTSARTFAATVDALGKMVQMLGVPPEETWTKIPGVTQQDVDRWKATAKRGDSFSQLTQLLDRQAAPANGPNG